MSQSYVICIRNRSYDKPHHQNNSYLFLILINVLYDIIATSDCFHCLSDDYFLEESIKRYTMVGKMFIHFL